MSVPLHFTLGDAFRRVRVMRGWTAKELAHRAGVSANTITALEDDRSQRHTQEKVAAVLGVPLRDIEAMLTPHTSDHLREAAQRLHEVAALLSDESPPKPLDRPAVRRTKAR